jgi:ABC-2 type transport system permease protein
MNFIDKFLLKIFLFAGPLLQKMNVNMDQLRAILVAKLTMDNRRPAAFQQMQRSKEKKEVNSATLKTMFISLFMGMFFLLSFEIVNDLTSGLTVFFSMFIFMLAATLITDFTSVLIDTRDNMIILPKPINDATFVTARLVHIAIHINKLVIPLAVPSLIFLFIKIGLVIVAPFMLMVFLATMLSIFLINAVYILILKIIEPAKFQSVISYFQIAFAIFIYGGYQLLPRMMNASGMGKMVIGNVKNIIFYPPYWFAEACNSLKTLSFNKTNSLILFLAFGVPVLSIYSVIKFLAPSFNRQLSMINSSNAEVSLVASSKVKYKNIEVKVPMIEKLASLLTKGSGEFMGFLFTWKMMSRSRDFKMKVYPGFGYIIVMVAMFVLQSKNLSLSDFREMTSHAKTIIIAGIYISSLVVSVAINQLAYSDKFKAAWIFAISPLENPGKIISGAVKAVLAQFYLPIVIVFSVPVLILSGIGILPNLMLGCFNILTISAIIAYFNLKTIPFSASAQNASKGSTFIKSMLNLFIPTMMGILHWFLFDFRWAIIILLPFAVIATWMVLDSIRNLSWAKVESFDIK